MKGNFSQVSIQLNGKSVFSVYFLPFHVTESGKVGVMLRSEHEVWPQLNRYNNLFSVIGGSIKQQDIAELEFDTIKNTIIRRSY